MQIKDLENKIIAIWGLGREGNAVWDYLKKHNIEIIVDRLVISQDIRSRLTESVEIALKNANNLVAINVILK